MILEFLSSLNAEREIDDSEKKEPSNSENLIDSNGVDLSEDINVKSVDNLKTETVNISYDKTGIKKYFSFDNEPITGWNFFWRNVIAVFGLFLFVLPGLWLWAVNGYKRAGAFNWSHEMRVISAISVVIAQIANFLSRIPSYYDSPLNLFDYISFPCVILMFILLVKNGNKNL